MSLGIPIGFNGDALQTIQRPGSNCNECVGAHDKVHSDVERSGLGQAQEEEQEAHLDPEVEEEVPDLLREEELL